MRKVFCLLFLGAWLVAGGKSDDVSESNDQTIVVRYLVAQGPSSVYTTMVADEFNASQDRVRVEIVDGPFSATDLYTLILQTFESQLDSIDVFPVDTIWPGDFAEHLVDLNTLGAREIAAQMFDSLVSNNTLDGRLLALPAVNTASLMVYRKDLLQKYGYNEPPLTLDELEEMASTIQQGERAENPDFWGYVWQALADEGLTCIFLEWTYSNSDDVWIDKNRKITVNKPQNVAILERAKGWIGTISPPGVLASDELQARAFFQSGNAAFFRTWFYAYALADADDSPLQDLVGVASIPAADSGHGAATIGAWSRGISRYSKHPKEAFEFLKFALSYENTLRNAKLTSDFPPYKAAYRDEAFLQEVPAIALLNPIFENSVARPSTITAPNYNAVSTVIARKIHSFLAGRIEAADALEELAFDLRDLTGFELAN